MLAEEAADLKRSPLATRRAVATIPAGKTVDAWKSELLRPVTSKRWHPGMDRGAGASSLDASSNGKRCCGSTSKLNHPTFIRI